MTPLSYDEIRPYNDSEVKAVIERLLRDDLVVNIVSSFFPEKSKDELIAEAKGLNSIDEFQSKFIHKMVRRVAKKSTDGITYSGFEKPDKNESYLMISNHRDIILDSAFLNILLKENDLRTTEIAIGDNLLINQWITDIVKLNKSFVVHRDVPVRQMVDFSKRLSSYIRRQIKENNNSIWIAQREGRAKDGNDKTQPGLLKMFQMSSDKGFSEAFTELKIVPLCLSYEFDPCDITKIHEVYMKSNNLTFKKSNEDDLNSMMMGINGYKGRVHLAVGDPVVDELKEIEKISNKNDQLKKLAETIDEKIYELYHLWPNNYLAFDLLNESDQYTGHYSEEDKTNFVAYIQKRLDLIPNFTEQHRQLLLKFYSYPLSNKLKV
jgi:1-acyl-sn-glycerol-3-phosphate acyltransferase